MGAQHSPDLCLVPYAVYPIFTLGTMNSSGQFVASDGTTKATLILVEEAYSTDRAFTVKPIGTGVIQAQMSTSWTRGAQLYQAAAGKLTTSSANSALPFGQACDAETKVSGSNNYGRVLVTR